MKLSLRAAHSTTTITVGRQAHDVAWPVQANGPGGSFGSQKRDGAVSRRVCIGRAVHDQSIFLPASKVQTATIRVVNEYMPACNSGAVVQTLLGFIAEVLLRDLQRGRRDQRGLFSFVQLQSAGTGIYQLKLPGQ